MRTVLVINHQIPERMELMISVPSQLEGCLAVGTFDLYDVLGKDLVVALVGKMVPTVVVVYYE
jgi:hypothetical protein